jgi:hypothetical protein
MGVTAMATKIPPKLSIRDEAPKHPGRTRTEKGWKALEKKKKYQGMSREEIQADLNVNKPKKDKSDALPASILAALKSKEAEYRKIYKDGKADIETKVSEHRKKLEKELEDRLAKEFK